MGEAEAFRFLIGRLAVNIDTRHAAAAFAGGDEGVARAEIEKAVDAAVREAVVNVLVIDGSRRPKSNTGAIARDLEARLAAAGPDGRALAGARSGAPGRRRRTRLWRGWPRADVVVLVAPSYLDELPAVTQRLLEDVWERRAELDGHAPLFYGVAHSGFPEPIQRRAELRSMRFFAEQMGWTWMGGVGFGGTSPIDGRPLDEAGMFSRQLRKVLPLAAADIAAAREFSPETVVRSDRSAVPDADQDDHRAGQLAHAQDGARQAARARREGVRFRLTAAERRRGEPLSARSACRPSCRARAPRCAPTARPS